MVEQINRPVEQGEKNRGGDTEVLTAAGAALSRPDSNSDYQAMKASAASTPTDSLPNLFIGESPKSKPGDSANAANPGDEPAYRPATVMGELRQGPKPGDPNTKTYVQDPPKLEGSTGPETVTVDTNTGATTIVAPSKDSGDGSPTTRTTTIPAHDEGGTLARTTVVTEGKPGDTPGNVLKTEVTDANGNKNERTFQRDAQGNIIGIDFHTMPAHPDSNHTNSNRHVDIPTDAKDLKVDPTTGELTYTRADGVKVGERADGTETMTTPPDGQGRSRTVTIGPNGGDLYDGKVTVTSSVNGKEVQTYEPTVGNPDSLKLDADGTLHMDLNGRGTVTVAADGKETTTIGDTTVVRDHPGGKVTSFETKTKDGQTVSLLDKNGNPLPGLTTDTTTLLSHPPEVTLYPNSNMIESYHTPADVQVHLDKNGSPYKYEKNGDSLWQGTDGKWYDTDSKGITSGPMTEPTLDKDGNVNYTFEGREFWESVAKTAGKAPNAFGKILSHLELEFLKHSNWSVGGDGPNLGHQTIPPMILPRWNPGQTGPTPKSP